MAAAIALGGTPSIAAAQDAPDELPQPAAAPAQTPPPVAPGAADDDVFIPTDAEAEEDVFTGEEEVIVVTGSLIERRELTTSAPLAVLDKSELDAAGVASIGDILQNLPSQSNAINVQFNNGGDGSTRVNLRGLGAARTLVLVNGRRHVAGGTGANASVDLNAIPTAVIERVEVLKDGASAIYGSDAISGVVNIITRTNFDGVEAAVYTGSTGDGLGQVFDVSVVMGQTTERGNIVFAAGFTDQQPINAGERDFSRSDKAYDWETGEVATSGSSATPQGVLIDRNPDAVGNDAWQQVVANNPDSGGAYYNDPVAGWRTFNAFGNSDVGEGDLYNYQPENYLVTPQQRYNVFSTGSYKFHDNVRGYFEATYTNRSSDQKLAPEPLFTITEGITVSGDNYYNPFGRDFVDIRRRMVEADVRRSIQDVNTFRVVTGIDGHLPEDLPVLQNWRWDLSFNYGRTKAEDINAGNFQLSKVANAIGPSFVGADGTPQCGTPDNPIAGCVPLNLFGGVGTITQDQLDYITYNGINSGFNEQQMFMFSTAGKVVDLPNGGDISLAIGAEYRKEAGADLPNPLVATGDTTGNKSEPTEGSYNVREGYAELSVVPLVGAPGAEWVELNAAIRAFDYNTFGSDYTWKVGARWSFGEGLAVRGTYSTAFRAPAISDLYSGVVDGFPPVTDPCDVSQGSRSDNVQANCSADGVPDNYVDSRTQIRTLGGGNEDLQPETAKVFTVGAVYEPKFVEGLALTLDYFDIAVDNAISSLGAGLILSSCYSLAPEERKYCELIDRNPDTNFLNVINDTAINVGGNETRGLDFNVRYTQNTDIGSFRYNLEGTRLFQFDSIEADGSVIEGLGVYDLGVFPTWRGNLGLMWGLDEWGAGTNVRYIHSFVECENDDCLRGTTADGGPRGEGIDVYEREVSANVTADLFGTYTLESSVGTSRLTLGVNNVLDQRPAIIYNGFLATSDASTYDFLGRYFYARFVQQF
ncbi:TonB-dependent receptor plug domain-containing protein [Haliangium ochraceum]|uniref:TonB-dependent receptor n=1 Tax=Haliangium ochraceum (strain DSM 14365 / JCM 11303 / SMP-2) TaxID=502025 RepID=D0LTW7_HALO1|nr:TonB-dependent receptor [Haliangium ochraceum]ACY15811.1 TonB-dependent receptor [Haliangium ochraceum DSM 14365]